MTSATRNDFQIGENSDPTKNLFIEVLEDGQAIINRGSRGGTLQELARFDLNGKFLLAKNPNVVVAASTEASQTIPLTTYTKVNCTFERIDSHDFYDAANSRFQPQIEGWYRVGGAIRFNASVSALLRILEGNGGITIIDDSTGYSLSGSAIIYFNGTTDYVELQAYSRTATATESSRSVFFNATLEYAV